MITKEKIPWCFIKLSQLILKGNVWRSVWRICMWILGLNGLKRIWRDGVREGGRRRGKGGCKLCMLSISGLCFSRKKWQKRQLEMRLRSQATPQYKTITFIIRWNIIVRVSEVPNRTVVDSDCRFDNFCGSHLHSPSELCLVSWWYCTLFIDLIGQL